MLPAGSAEVTSGGPAEAEPGETSDQWSRVDLNGRAAWGPGRRAGRELAQAI